MINKIKKSVAAFLTSLVAFGGLVSAAGNSEANVSNSQPITSSQSLAPIGITVVNEESTITKLLSATKIILLGTGTVGVGTCCYKAYKVIDNTGKNIQGVFDVTKTGINDVFQNLKNLLGLLSKEQAKQLIDDIHKILSECGNSVEAINNSLRKLDIERFNGIAPAVVAMINSLTKSIKDILEANDENGGKSVLLALLSLFSQKIQTSKA